MKNKTLDIVLPCYNPVGEWVKEITSAYKTITADLEDVIVKIILVNDGSKSKVNLDFISLLKKEIPHFDYISYPENQGKGFALREGVKNSTAEICIYTDRDFPYTSQSLIELYRQLNKGQDDIVVGIKNETYYQKLPPFRVKVSRFLRFLIRTFLRLSVSDTQCGLKGFNQKGKTVFLQTTINRYLCDLEFIFLAERNKSVSLTPLKIQLREGVEFSKVNLKILLREGLNFLGILLRSLVRGA